MINKTIVNTNSGVETKIPFTDAELEAHRVEREEWASGETDRQFFSLRATRNELLKNSDWSNGLDSPLSSDAKINWAAYRQALRDLPATVIDPANPIWPTPPE
jgi:hypothetical protein|tara:strand:- start:308 stop:616 length:309 start_codon:yes stop_codon:yes gene_type:complete